MFLNIFWSMVGSEWSMKPRDTKGWLLERQSWLQPAGWQVRFLSYSIISPSRTMTVVKNVTYFVVFHSIKFFMNKQCCVYEKSSLGDMITMPLHQYIMSMASQSATEETWSLGTDKSKHGVCKSRTNSQRSTIQHDYIRGKNLERIWGYS